MWQSSRPKKDQREAAACIQHMSVMAEIYFHRLHRWFLALWLCVRNRLKWAVIHCKSSTLLQLSNASCAFTCSNLPCEDALLPLFSSRLNAVNHAVFNHLQIAGKSWQARLYLWTWPFDLAYRLTLDSQRLQIHPHSPIKAHRTSRLMHKPGGLCKL